MLKALHVGVVVVGIIGVRWSKVVVGGSDAGPVRCRQGKGRPASAVVVVILYGRTEVVGAMWR